MPDITAPMPGKIFEVNVTQGDTVGSIEAEKFVGPIIAAVSGTITRVNEAVMADPGLIMLVRERWPEIQWLGSWPHRSVRSLLPPADPKTD